MKELKVKYRGVASNIGEFTETGRRQLSGDQLDKIRPMIEAVSTKGSWWINSKNDRAKNREAYSNVNEDSFEEFCRVLPIAPAIDAFERCYINKIISIELTETVILEKFF